MDQTHKVNADLNEAQPQPQPTESTDQDESWDVRFQSRPGYSSCTECRRETATIEQLVNGKIELEKQLALKEEELNFAQDETDADESWDVRFQSRPGYSSCTECRRETATIEQLVNEKIELEKQLALKEEELNFAQDETDADESWDVRFQSRPGYSSCTECRRETATIEQLVNEKIELEKQLALKEEELNFAQDETDADESWDVRFQSRPGYSSCTECRRETATIEQLVNEKIELEKQLALKEEELNFAQDETDADESWDVRFQSRPGYSSCTECRRETATIEQLVNEKIELEKQLALKEEELNFAQDETDADESWDVRFQSRPGYSSCTECRRETATIEQLVNEKIELEKQLALKEEELNFAQDETDADESWDVRFQCRPGYSSCTECCGKTATIEQLVNEKIELEKQLALKEEELNFAQDETDADESWDVLSQSRPGYSSCTECRRKTATIQQLEKQLALKEEELNFAQDVVKAKYIELEKRNTKLEEDLDNWLIIDGKDFADGEDVKANFASAIGELDIDVPQQLKEGGLSQERTSDEEHECLLVLDKLKCPVNCVQAVFFNIVEELGYEMCWNTFIKEMQRQLDAKRGMVGFSTCNIYHLDLKELGLIIPIFFKLNIDSEVECKEALEQAVKKMEDEDAPGLLLVCQKDDIGHCVQITPKSFQSASAGKTDFFDVEKKKSWPECAKNFNSIHTLIVFKIDKDMLELFRRPCGRVNCVRAKHRALSAKL